MRYQIRALGLAILLMCGSSYAGPVSQNEASSPEALKFAEQLNAALLEKGLKASPTESITAIYGTSGGLSCIAVGTYQQLAGQNMFGSPSIGRRIIMDPKVLAYDETVVSIYCPDKLEQFKHNTHNLKTSETIEAGH